MKHWRAWTLGILSVVALQALILVATRGPAKVQAPAHWTTIAPADYRALPALIPHAGRPMVLYFWATWCEPCTRHLPEHVALAEALADEVDIWLIARDTTPEAVALYFDGQPPPAVVRDRDGRLGDALGVAVLPTSFFVTADGRVLARTLDSLEAVSITRLLTR